MNNPDVILNSFIYLWGLKGYYILIPEILLFFLILIILLLSIFISSKNINQLINKLSIITLIIISFILFFLPYEGYAFGESLFVSPFQIFLKILILMCVISILIMSRSTSFIEGVDKPEFSILCMVSVLGMMLMVSSFDLITLYISIELQAIPIYILCASRKGDLRSSESAIKYFLLGTLSSGIILFGMSLIYGYSSTTSFQHIKLVLENSSSNGILLGMVFLISGMAFKISAVPFHMWSPDVYEGSPTPITALIGTAPKIASIGVFLLFIFY